jgi:signal transduction histidine kinase
VHINPIVGFGNLRQRRPHKGWISLIVVEMLLIFGLAWQRARRRRVETDLATTNERLRLTVEAGKSVGWDWDIKSGRDHWFGDLQTVFGIPSDTYSGLVEEFRQRIYPEDRELVWKAVADARRLRKQYVTEFRVVREDGMVRWIAARGKFYYAANGDAERMLGMAVDITDRKMAEEALVSLSGRLMEAQEEERRRIAREIHDDYQQRLAMVAIDLDTLAQDIGNSPVDAKRRLHELWSQISELGGDLHALSHRLHSSTLEGLGLVLGVSSLCAEFADQHGIQVDFANEDVPYGISEDAALCLFRVVQEGLRNVKRHSGANRAEVRLEGLGGNLHLSISDRGRGFASNGSRSGGIGIQSMEERLRLLGGRLEIHSRPMEGTKIDAWLPFHIAIERAG